MSKKLLVLALVAALIAAFAAPSMAKKKKKGPKPYTSETVTVELGHPMFHSTSGTLVGVTPQEFLNGCALPSSNGFDAYVFEVPAEYQKITSLIEAEGVGTTDGAVPADIDIYLFDETCAPAGVFNTAGTSESGALNAGVAFVVLHNYTGGPTDMSFTLTPAKF
jgi:extracellular elastinolytic metalloproteinase